MADIHSYFASVNACIGQRSGGRLASILALPLRGVEAQHRLLAEKARGINLISYATSNVSEAGVAAVVGHRLLAVTALVSSDLRKAYEHELAAYNSVLEYLKEENSSWILPALIRTSDDLRQLAIQVDSASSGNDFLRNSLENLTKGFTAVAKDRTPVSSPGSKKPALFAVTNVLFKIYFRVNTLQLCSKLISVIDGPSGAGENLHLYPLSDVAMYKYYLGRLKLFEDKQEEAREHLRFALRHTPLGLMKNRQRILASLIPVEMSLGVMPTDLVATKYGFHEYLAMANAAKIGDLRSLEKVHCIWQVHY